VDVSVVISTKNRREGLLTCLAHLEQQTFPAARFEVVLVDAGSTDDTFDTISRYAEGAPVRTRCVRMETGGTPAGRNVGAREAEGRWLLFLDSKLFASPNLIERHVRAQERCGGNVAIVGSVSPHPQMEAGSFNRWFMPDPGIEFAEQRALPYLTWRRANMSLPRSLFLDAGGFDESFQFAQFSDAELAWRLSRQDAQGFYAPEAHAYVFVPTSFEQERRRQYAKGYSLHALLQRTGDTSLLSRYGLSDSRFCEGLKSLAMPVYIRACTRADEKSRLFSRLYPRILRHDLCTGYTDARRGREPRRGDMDV